MGWWILERFVGSGSRFDNETNRVRLDNSRTLLAGNIIVFGGLVYG